MTCVTSTVNHRHYIFALLIFSVFLSKISFFLLKKTHVCSWHKLCTIKKSYKVKFTPQQMIKPKPDTTSSFPHIYPNNRCSFEDTHNITFRIRHLAATDTIESWIARPRHIWQIARSAVTAQLAGDTVTRLLTTKHISIGSVRAWDRVLGLFWAIVACWARSANSSRGVLCRMTHIHSCKQHANLILKLSYRILYKVKP